MARQWRIEYPGALYHVLSRGNNRQNIFVNDDGRQMFLELMEEFNERFRVEDYAYVLMSNHYHILLKTNEANLSKSMQCFGSTYTRRFNVKNGVSGHLFQGRFKSIFVENDSYLMRLSCYIHRNPLRTGIVKRFSNQTIGSLMGLTYSSISKQVSQFRRRLAEDNGLLKNTGVLIHNSRFDPISDFSGSLPEYGDSTWIEGSGWIVENESGGKPNETPVVDAGLDQTITLPNDTITLNGVAVGSCGNHKMAQ